MKVLFTGLPYFGKQLVAELNVFDAKNTYVFCNTYYSKWERLRFLWHLITAKKVVSFNGVTSESLALNWTLRFRKALIMQWHGSDVLTAAENKSNGKFTRKYVDVAQSYTDAPWLKKELAEMNIAVSDLAFKHVSTSNFFEPFQSRNVITYLAQDNEEFYGLHHFLKLANQFPDIQFHVVGSDGKNIQAPKNMIFHGWVSEEGFKTRLNENAVFIRLTKHDGYSLSVLRALANGNYVIWNNPHPMVNYVEHMEQLPVVFGHLIERINEKTFERNREAMEWVNENLDRKRILEMYIQTILNKH